jgi:HicB family
MTHDHAISLPGQPMQWAQQEQAPTAKSKDPAKPSRLQKQKSLKEPVVKEDVPSSKQVKQLSFRINESTHSKISLAAQRAGSSVNAWMETVLSEAADDVLDRPMDDSAISSPVIRHLIEDPNCSKELIIRVAPSLEDNSFTSVFQFSHALKKLLIGWDRMQPFLFQEQTKLLPELVQCLSKEKHGSVVQIAAGLLPVLQADTSTSIIQFSHSLKKFLLGVSAVKTFLKEEQTQHACQVVIEIEKLLREVKGV